MSKGLLNLEGIENMGDNDILDLNINESGTAEFGSNDPATNPTVTFDPNSTSAKETSVPIPGGIKETPTAKPADGETGVTIPGGNGETPSGKPYDASSVSIPAKTTLTSDQYNNAISALKKTFKEGVEIMELLESANIVHKTETELQQEYTEGVLEQAIIDAYGNGPMFESADDPKKEEIKKAAKAIVRCIKDKRKGSDGGYENVTNLREATWIARLVGNNPEIGRKAWKNVASFNAPKGKISGIVAKFCKEFSEELGELTLNVDCVVDFDALSKADSVSDKDKKSFDDASDSVGNFYFMYVDSKKNDTIATVKVHGLKAAVAKLK